MRCFGIVLVIASTKGREREYRYRFCVGLRTASLSLLPLSVSTFATLMWLTNALYGIWLLSANVTHGLIDPVTTAWREGDKRR